MKKHIKKHLRKLKYWYIIYIMVLYECDLCLFYSNLKSDYKRHLNTKKHQHNSDISLTSMVKTQKDPEKTQKDPEKTQKDPEKTQSSSEDVHCSYCYTLFSTYAHKRRHELHRCKENTSINNSKIKELEKDKKKLEKKLEKTFDKLIAKAGNTTINNIQSTQNNQQNIKLNNYGSEDLSHITDFFKTQLLSLPYGMIPKMIEAVHFNKEKPENKNILFPNKKENRIKIFSGDKWIYKDKNETIDDLIDGKYFIMDTHYETVCNTSEKNFNLYKRFQRLFDKRDEMIVEEQKKECELLLLNNR
jgi:hypothetical protein